MIFMFGLNAAMLILNGQVHLSSTPILIIAQAIIFMITAARMVILYHMIIYTKQYIRRLVVIESKLFLIHFN